MNIKTKAIGLLAGSALALSLATGAMADTGTSSATLAQNPNASGCVFSGTNAFDADFGTYTWDGTQYVAETGAGSVTLSIGLTQDIEPTHDCDIQVESTTPLTSGANTIPDSSITATAVTPGIGGGTIDTVQSLTYTVAATGTDAGITLGLATPGATQPTGSYAGVITFTAPTGL